MMYATKTKAPADIRTLAHHGAITSNSRTLSRRRAMTVTPIVLSAAANSCAVQSGSHGPRTQKRHAIGVLSEEGARKARNTGRGLPKIVKPTTRNALRRRALDLKDAPLNALAAWTLPNCPRNGRLFREIFPWDLGDLLEPIALHEAAPAVGRMPGSTEFAARYQAKDGPIANSAVNSYDSARLVSTRSRAPR
jgi:hypothetical protein